MLLLLCPRAAGGQAWDVAEGDDYELEASTRRGLRFEMEDPDIELRVGGRLHWDAAWFDDDRSPIEDADELRRGRVYLEGNLFEDWSFKIERELAGPGDSWKNLWIGYQPTENLKLRVGNFIAPFGLEEVASSNYTTFLERALPLAFAPSYQTGVGISTRGRFGDERRANRWSWSTAGYVEPMGDREDDPQGTDHWGVASRFTFAPLARKRQVLHLGASVNYQSIKSDEDYHISSRPESALAPTLLNTGGLPDVDSVVALGGEAATVLGPFSTQGEYLWSRLQRSDGRRNAQFDGWYVQASYVLTGERRRYSASSGTFQGVKPKRAWGAVEVAARYSTINLDDTSVSGGHAQDWSFGLSWYLRENLRLMFNYIHVDAIDSDGDRDDPQIFSVRAMVFF